MQRLHVHWRRAGRLAKWFVTCLPVLVSPLNPALASPLPPASSAATTTIRRLDCGVGRIPEALLSDTFAYSEKHIIAGVVSCYLIRHGDRYLLWDAGLGPEFSTPLSPSGRGFYAGRGLIAQLAILGLRSDDISYVAVSHWHFDHIGQAGHFARATLLIGARDWDVLKAQMHERPDADPGPLKPWLMGGSPAQPVSGDLDVFGDGSVIMLDTPGHTPGHHSLLVRPTGKPAALLTGDLWHMHSQIAKGDVSDGTQDRAALVASHARILAIARHIKARLIVSHDPGFSEEPK